MKNFQIKIILIAGGTASGKTFFSELLAAELNQKTLKTSVFKVDNYYHPVSYLANKYEVVNFDDPKAFDWSALLKDLKKILNHQIVYRNIYDFQSGEYKAEKFEIKPAHYIIIDGLFALYNKDLIKLSTERIFIDSDADLRLIRRFERDQKSRYQKTFNSKDFIERWKVQIRPMYIKYIEPTKNNATLIVKNNYNNKEDFNFEVKKILNKLIN